MSLPFQNPYKSMLDESASMIAPSKETSQRIFDAVMISAGTTAAISVVAASGQVASLTQMAVSKAISGVVASTVGTAAVAAASATMLVPPAIADISVENLSWTESSIQILVENPATVDSVRIHLPKGGAVLAARKGEGRYATVVDRNGDYTVEVVGQGGQKAEAVVEIREIDDLIPVMDRYMVGEDRVTIFFHDTGSGIDWNSLYAVDVEGNRTIPLEISPPENRVVFPLSDTDMEIFLSDLAGNRASTIVYIESITETVPSEK